MIAIHYHEALMLTIINIVCIDVNFDLLLLFLINAHDVIANII